MLFNSIDFALFFPLFFIIYWSTAHSLRIQNAFTLISSYIFYGWWDWRFLLLILVSTLVDYILGKIIFTANEPVRKKLYLTLSLFTNLSLLGFFKYFNFFIESLQGAFTFFGQGISISTLSVVLPVGISFYTFQTLSYTIDVYRGKIVPSDNPVAFAAFVSFFPQLVAGPIERASHLLPQFTRKRRFNYQSSVDGLRQALWGFFKKMVVADNCALYVDQTFGNADQLDPLSLLLGAIFFTIQIYCDFSGYSDIAIGLSRTLGFDLMRNFAFPFFSRDIAEFWRKWHISLTTWFRDYLYIPLGGSRGSLTFQIRNIILVFVISGFWHGANWTFIVWGLLNAVYYLPLLLGNINRSNMDTVASGRTFPSLKETIQMCLTFLMTTLAFIFFRSENLQDSLNYLINLFSWSAVELDITSPKLAVRLLMISTIMITIEWIGREEVHALKNLLLEKNKYVRWIFYTAIIFFIGLYMRTDETPFIYFQF